MTKNFSTSIAHILIGSFLTFWGDSLLSTDMIKEIESLTQNFTRFAVGNREMRLSVIIIKDSHLDGHA